MLDPLLAGRRVPFGTHYVHLYQDVEICQQVSRAATTVRARIASVSGVDRPAVAEDVVCHEEEGEAFLLHLATGRYFGLNATGLEVWTALVAGLDPVDALHRRWPETSVEVCRSDTQKILADLEEAGLIRESDQKAQ